MYVWLQDWGSHMSCDLQNLTASSIWLSYDLHSGLHSLTDTFCGLCGCRSSCEEESTLGEKAKISVRNYGCIFEKKSSLTKNGHLRCIFLGIWRNF